MAATAERKQQVLDFLLTKGPADIHCLPKMCKGLPARLVDRDYLILTLDRGFKNRPKPSLEAEGVSALLNFQGEECRVSIPWASITAAVSVPLGEVIQWPQGIETSANEAPAPAALMPAQEKKSRPSFLRAVGSDEGEEGKK